MLRPRELDPMPRLSNDAAATRPAEASAPTTPADGLVEGSVTLAAADGPVPAYRARPSAGASWPIVVVVSEIFGVHAYIVDVVRRFARLGCYAIAPEMFVRQGDVKEIAEIGVLVSTVISKVPDAQAMADLDAAVDFAAGEGGDVGRLGVTGFCWGGRQTWLYCAHNPKVKAGVAWYGRLVGPTNALQTSQPVDEAANLHAPVLGLYGGQDTGIPLDSVEKMRMALAQGSGAARASEFVIYHEAGHAFHADYRPSYDATAAKDGWERCVAWLRTYGVA